MAEKTEQATPKKLKDARKKGQVAKSQDFPSAFTFIVSVSTVILTAGYLFQELYAYCSFIFRSINKNLDLSKQIGGFLTQAFIVILSCSLPIALVTVCTGIMISFLIVGPVFSSEVLKLDLKRLNPVTNLKNMFKIKTFIELLKSILKISGAFVLIYTVLYTSVPEVIATAALPIMGSAMVFSNFVVKVVIRVGIFFLCIAVFDLVFQRLNFMKEMKMEKFEVKQEHKDTEGDPQMKSKRKQIAQEVAYQDGPSAAKKAKAIVVNPTHIAVALDYDENVDAPPLILTMGKDFFAEQIIKIGQQANVPIMRDVDLARKLFYEGIIGESIPAETFEAVAKLLQIIKSLEDGNAEIFQ